MYGGVIGAGHVAQSLQGIANAYAPKPEPKPMQAMRTREEIMAQLEARYAEIEAEANSPRRQFPCASCRWADKFEAAWCHQPLVKGFGDRVHMGMGEEISKTIPNLCGPEKALWEPKQSIWQKFAAWFLAPWKGE